jgi:hypothetical protein
MGLDLQDIKMLTTKIGAFGLLLAVIRVLTGDFNRVLRWVVAHKTAF